MIASRRVIANEWGWVRVKSEVEMSRRHSRVTNARNDVMTGGIIVASIIMFVGTGSEVMSGVIATLLGVGGGVDKTLSVVE